MMILKEFSRIVCVSLFSYQGSLLVYLTDSLFTLPHLIDCVKYFFEVFYFSKFKTSNGEGGIWTLAPLLTTYSLSRGAPSANLGTSPKTERVGFEPTRPCGQTVFKTASLWPLRYPCTRAGDGNRTHVSSLEGWCSTIELHPHIVPSSGIEPETRGFSVLCSTNWAN